MKESFRGFPRKQIAPYLVQAAFDQAYREAQGIVCTQCLIGAWHAIESIFQHCEYCGAHNHKSSEHLHREKKPEKKFRLNGLPVEEHIKEVVMERFMEATMKYRDNNGNTW